MVLLTKTRMDSFVSPDALYWPDRVIEHGELLLGRRSMPVLMHSIFEELKAEKFENPLSTQPAYRMRFGPYEVEAAVFTNRCFRETFFLSGIINTGRTLSPIESELPLEVDSREQGLAMLAYCLRSEIPEHLKPDWLRAGEEFREHLPWEKDREEYRKRPLCFIDREWMRIACRKLREHASGAVEYDTTSFYFDGAVLKIFAHATESSARRLCLAMPAEGDAWMERNWVSTWRLESLPRRLMTRLVEVSVWQGFLVIANHRFPVLTTLQEESAPDPAETTIAVFSATPTTIADEVADIADPPSSERPMRSEPLAEFSFFEVEDRLVAEGSVEGRGWALVWSSAKVWRPAPGLVSKVGVSLTDEAARAAFPDADFSSLKKLSQDVPETAFG